MFSVRIVNVDHYLSAPLQGLDITYSQFRGSRVKQVPVIRIFGSTPTGQKTCLHVHGVFPYLLIPYDGKENVQALMYIIATSLDKAINISFGVSNSNKQHVFKIVQVSGSPFYGYHEVEHQFLKIFFYNPNVVKRAADFLQNGAICNKVLQPHGAHVPFTLQFFIDYNLHGMSFIHLKQVVFRKNIVEESDEAEIGFERLSRCELEVDAIATDISNKCDITENIAVNPGLAGIWEEEKQRRKDDNNFFEPIQSQPRLNVETTPSELLLKNKLRNTLSQQNRCSNPQLTSQIPYPAETQKGSDILNASAVNVHCMLPLTAVKPDNRLDESIVDEDIIHTLTSQSDEQFTLSTQDQSLLTVLLNLAGHEDENGDKEETKENNQSSCKIHYTVEDDSILGSQLLTNAEEEEDLLEACQKIEDTELQINITQNMEKEVVSENIPQIDGTDDLLNRMNTEKHKNSVNSCTEDCEIKMFEDDNSCSIIDMSAEVQSPNLWPLVGIRKEIDCCDEVFSDSIEAIKFVERSDSDVCINIEDNFDDVLRGDIFMSQTVASSFDDASFYTSKESLTCAWNNSLPIQSLENSESDDFLITRLNDIDKLGDNQLKVESYLSDVTEKHLQFNDNLVPLLNLSEGEESVYNKYIDSNPTFYSNDVLDKKQLLDIFKESIELQIQENEGRTPHEDSNSNSSILLKKEKLSLRNQGKQRSVKNIQFSKIKIKFKFPNKGETINSNKKLRFLRRKTVCDISKKHVLAYFRKLEKLKKSYLSAKASFISNKKQKSNKQLTEKSSFRKKLKFQEVQNKNCFVNNLNKYKLKKCFVLVERLQLNSDLIVVKKNTNDTKSIKPRKIINELEVLQSRPFSTDILNSSSKTNKHMRKLKLINKVNDVGEILNKQKVNETKSYCLLSETKPDGDQKVNDCNNIDLNYCDKNDKHYRTDILNNNKRRRKIHVAENKGEVIHSKTNTSGVKKKQTKHKLNNCINVCDGDNVSAPLLQVFNQETINTEIIENVHNNKSTSNNSKSPNLVKTSKENQDNEVCNLLKMIPKIEKVVDETIKYKSNIKPLSEKKRKENVKINSDNLEIETKGCNTRNSLKNMKINCAVQLNESNKLESKKRTHQNDGKTNFKHIGMGRKMQSKRNNYHTTEIKKEEQANKIKKIERMEITSDTKHDIEEQKIGRRLQARRNSERIKRNINNSRNKELKRLHDKMNDSKVGDIVTTSDVSKTSKQTEIKTKIIKKNQEKQEHAERKMKKVSENNGFHNKFLRKKKHGRITIMGSKSTEQEMQDAQDKISLVIKPNIILRRIKTEDCMITSTNDMQRKTSRSDKLKTRETKGRQALNRRFNREKLSKIQFLDGTVDSMSSSSDESVNSELKNFISEKTRTPQKKTLGSANAETPPRYKRLNVQIKKSPKSEKSSGSAGTLANKRHSEMERILDIQELGSPSTSSLSEDRNLKNSELEIKQVTGKHISNVKSKKSTLGLVIGTESCFLTSDVPKNNTPPLRIAKKKKYNLRLANSYPEQHSVICYTDNIKPMSQDVFPKEGKSTSVLQNELGVTVKSYKTNKLHVNKGCTTHVSSSMAKSQEGITAISSTKTTKEPSTSVNTCAKTLQKSNNHHIKELRVCLRRLSPLVTDVQEKYVSKEKSKDSDSVNEIKASDKHSLANQVPEKCIGNTSNLEQESMKGSQCKNKFVRKMLNFQSEEKCNKNYESVEKHAFETVSNSAQSSLWGNETKHSNLGNKCLRSRAASIDLFASSSSETQNSSISWALKNNSDKEVNCPNISNNSLRALSPASTSNDFTKLSQSPNRVEGKLGSVNKVLNSTLPNIDEDDEGILSFYNQTLFEDSELPESFDIKTDIQDLNSSKETFNIEKGSKYYQPKENPPTSSKVKENLLKLGFPEELNESPFYSNPDHVSTASEIGGKTFKLISKSTSDLEEFQGTFNYMSKWQQNRFREICGQSQSYKDHDSVMSVLASDRRVIITPLKLPPETAAAKAWLKATSVLALKPVQENAKTKIKRITVPLSPGENSNSDEEIISSTPCTPFTPSTSPCTPFTNPSQPSEKLDTEVTPQELHVKLTSGITTSTPINVNSRKKMELATNSLIFTRGSHFTPLAPVAEENVDTSCDDKLNSIYSSSRHDNNKQASNSSHLSLDSQFRKHWNDKSGIASMSHQIDAVTPDNTGGFRMELENLQQVHPVSQHQYLTTLTVELHIHTRGDLRPDPQYDPICALFYNITDDSPETELNCTGALVVSSEQEYRRSLSALNCDFIFVNDEKELLQKFVSLVHKWDPDILAGYEIEMLSWGYLLQRAYVLAYNLKSQISRIIKNKANDTKDQENESRYKTTEDEEKELQLTGRIILNVWRLMRHEVALMSYTFENVMYHILHQRVPLFSFKTLSTWWSHRTHLHRWKTAEHYITRVNGVVKLVDQLDLIGRTSELARLFGIQFYEVLSRGSQFRVESMMLRLAKPLNYVAVSPSIKQRAKMRAPETLPLIMEPQSRFYCDPVIVLDFQSLYPSIIIAYNYCFSTCLGRVEHLGQSEIFEFGCTQLKVPFKTLLKLENEINFSPCGVAFVKETVKKGVLPQMLEEILNTRLMVKKSMKDCKNNKTLHRVLHARQLGLKLIANVTYGYTAANFSGRMPCIEVGDSVVSKGRETLERAITLIGQTSEWGAQVVYGDTDSMFVLVPGRSRKEALRIGAEIAEAVTNSNPKPVKLKLEKVYQPCILQTKKRYVGYMYESPDQEKPVYDAKGIETVRRDGCPAVAKVLEKSLRLLFETKDMSLVRKYVTRQFSKIILGRMSIQELTFAREYRGASGYRPGACVPALELAKQWRAIDPRAEPRIGERVPHVVVAGPPGLPLIRLVRSPSSLLQDPSLKINSEYYITRVIIPPLDRCFSLLGASVPSWYSELPRKHFICLPSTITMGNKKSTISQYFATMNCIVCQKLTTVGVCSECQEQHQKLAVTLSLKLTSWERHLRQVTKLCQSCCGSTQEIECSSLDCPVLYRRNQAAKDMNQADFVRQLQCEYLTF